MSHYIDDKLTIQPIKLDNGKWIWVTSREFSFHFGGVGGSVFIVPQGFETDLGSIPAALRWLLGPSDPDCVQAYVLHDYVNSLTDHRPPGIWVWSSEAAAAILYDALRCNNVPVWKADLICTGVRFGIAKEEK